MTALDNLARDLGTMFGVKVTTPGNAMKMSYNPPSKTARPVAGPKENSNA